MKRNIVLLFVLWGLLGPLNAQEFKNIGYVPYYRLSYLDQMNFNQVTHVNIAFANPTDEGVVTVGNKDITPIIDKAYEYDVEVYLSLAGGALSAEAENAWDKWLEEDMRSEWIHTLMIYALEYGLHGIDVDLEWSHVDDRYSDFILELRDSVDVYDLGLTAALPGTYRYPEITDEAMLSFDWINMMVYDLRGSWDPSNVGPHSPYSFAVSSINYWSNKGMPKERLTLGLPFYGYDFIDANTVKARTYRYIVDQNEQNAFKDQYQKIYYNGIPTIKKKTELAMEELGGVMVWELGHDHYSEYSLLNAINETIHGISSVENIESDFNPLIFPNPFTNMLSIEMNKKIERVNLFDTNGGLVNTWNDINTETISLGVQTIPRGVYYVEVWTNKSSKREKVIKI